MYKYVILSFNRGPGRYVSISMFADICLLFRNKTRRSEIACCPCPSQQISSSVCGGERKEVDFSKLIKSLLVSAESILFGYSGNSWMPRLWVLVEERRQDLLWLVNDPAIPTIITDWPAPCIPSDDLGLRINSGHLPLQPGPGWTTQT